MEEMLYLSNSSDIDCDINATIRLHSQWIHKYMGQCVVELKQYFALMIGLLSIVFWIFAQWPQIVINCKTGRSDESISIWCLMLWLISDSANFIGAILTKQLFTQIILAGYFIMLDLICVIQFIVHFVKNRGGLPGLKRMCVHRNGYKNLYIVPLVLLLPAMAAFLPLRNTIDHEVKWTTRNLLEVAQAPIIDTRNIRFMIGYVFGCISAVMYFFALPAQIIKNFQRCSVHGVSMTMFIFVTLGDASYLLGVLLFSTERVFIIRTMPWILGSAWSCLVDVAIVLQLLVYKCLSRYKLWKLKNKERMENCSA